VAEAIDRRSVAARPARPGGGALEAPGNAPGSTRALLLRLAESFFRHPILCLLPLVAFAAIGVLNVTSTSEKFVSAGIVNVSSDTLLSDLTELGGQDGFTWETPASITSRNINELLSTEQFTRNVAERAELLAAVDTGTLQLGAMRSWISAFPVGDNLVKVQVSTDDPALSARLALATIDGFVDWVIDGDIAESSAAEDFFDEQVQTYETDVAAARAALDEYLRANPVDEEDSRPAEQQVEVDRLTADVVSAEARLDNALASIETARLATAQARSDVGQRLRLVDTPQVPVFPESSRRQDAMMLAFYVVAGAIFSIGAVVLGASLDRSIRTADDAERQLQLEVLAVVPDARR
jgi:uncharacterized protein involved in exopolysaccharide biosynthesis